MAVAAGEARRQGAGGQVEAEVGDRAAGLAQIERECRTVLLPCVPRRPPACRPPLVRTCTKMRPGSHLVDPTRGSDVAELFPAPYLTFYGPQLESRGRAGEPGQGVARWGRRHRRQKETTRGQHDTAADGTTPGESRTVDLDGPVHYVDFGGPAERPRPSSSCTASAARTSTGTCSRPLLTAARPRLALDLPGFGLSEPGHRHGDRARQRAACSTGSSTRSRARRWCWWATRWAG